MKPHSPPQFTQMSSPYHSDDVNWYGFVHSQSNRPGSLRPGVCAARSSADSCPTDRPSESGGEPSHSRATSLSGIVHAGPYEATRPESSPWGTGGFLFDVGIHLGKAHANLTNA